MQVLGIRPGTRTKRFEPDRTLIAIAEAAQAQASQQGFADPCIEAVTKIIGPGAEEDGMSFSYSQRMFRVAKSRALTRTNTARNIFTYSSMRAST